MFLSSGRFLKRSGCFRYPRSSKCLNCSVHWELGGSMMNLRGEYILQIFFWKWERGNKYPAAIKQIRSSLLQKNSLPSIKSVTKNVLRTVTRRFLKSTVKAFKWWRSPSWHACHFRIIENRQRGGTWVEPGRWNHTQKKLMLYANGSTKIARWGHWRLRWKILVAEIYDPGQQSLMGKFYQILIFTSSEI